MIGHKVDNHLESLAVTAGNEVFEFGHARRHIFGEIRVNVVIVSYGIRAAGMSFDHVGVITYDAISGVVGVVGVLYDAGIPYMGDSE